MGGARLWTELLFGRRLPREGVLCGAVPAAAAAAVAAATAPLVAVNAPLAATSEPAAAVTAAAESGAALTLAAASVGVAVAATLPAAAIALVAARPAALAALFAAAVAGDAAAATRPATTVSGDATAASLRDAVPTAVGVACDPLALWWSAEQNSARVLHVRPRTRTLRGGKGNLLRFFCPHDRATHAPWRPYFLHLSGVHTVGVATPAPLAEAYSGEEKWWGGVCGGF